MQLVKFDVCSGDPVILQALWSSYQYLTNYNMKVWG